MLVGDGRGGRWWGMAPLVSSSVAKESLLIASPLAPKSRVRLGQRDGAQLPPIISFAAVGRPAIAVEKVRVGIGVEVEGFDLPGISGEQAMHDIGFKVEVRLAPGCIRKEAGIPRIRLDEAEAEG